MSEEDISDKSRLKSLIKLLLKTKGGLLKTEIVKLCFLVDHKAATSLPDHPAGFTTARYKKYYYGPFSDAFDTVLNEMEGTEVSLKKIINGTTKYFYELTVDETPEKILEDGRIRTIVEEVLSQTKGKSLNEIKDVVYGLECVKKAQFSDPIKLS